MSLLGKLKKQSKKESNQNIQDVSIPIIERAFDAGEYVDAAIMLKVLIENYGESKKKNHRYKGRAFIHFVLSSKHKDLKNVGYKHWVNINKIIQSKKRAAYPYHKQNLRNAINFYRKEIRSLNALKTIIIH